MEMPCCTICQLPLTTRLLFQMQHYLKMPIFTLSISQYPQEQIPKLADHMGVWLQRERPPAPQLIAVLTTGLPKTLFLQAGGTFTVNILFTFGKCRKLGFGG